MRKKLTCQYHSLRFKKNIFFENMKKKSLKIPIKKQQRYCSKTSRISQKMKELCPMNNITYRMKKEKHHRLDANTQYMEKK